MNYEVKLYKRANTKEVYNSRRFAIDRMEQLKNHPHCKKHHLIRVVNIDTNKIIDEYESETF